MRFSRVEIMVGLFMLLGCAAAVLLALKVAGLVWDSSASTYTVHARFDNIGQLKLRAPVRIGGVLIGRVEGIAIDPEALVPVVSMAIEERYSQLSSETRAAILTSGIIGEQYIGITPGFYDEELGTSYLQDGDYITDTASAVVLEDLIAKFLYSVGGGGSDGLRTPDPVAP